MSRLRARLAGRRGAGGRPEEPPQAADPGPAELADARGSRPGGLSVVLLKAALRYAARRKTRVRRRGPAAWRNAWEHGDGAPWPDEPVTGIIDHGGLRLVVDRCDVTRGGHLWLEGWALGPGRDALRLEARPGSVAWQANFATARPDVIQALQLSPTGSDQRLGMQMLARIADYVPGVSRLALTLRDAGGAPDLVVPVVPQTARSGTMWHALYDAMRHRGVRDADYLDTSVAMLKDLRKHDWRERNAEICRSIEAAMTGPGTVKVLVLSRLHPNAAYVNLNLLAAACPHPAEFVVCSMGQVAIRRASEYRSRFATIEAHRVGFVSAETGTPSSELIECFAVACRRHACPCLIVYDDVAVASAMTSLGEVLRGDLGETVAWPRRFPAAADAGPAFVEPLSDAGAGPYWRSAKALEHGALGALLWPARQGEAPQMPPFEGRGCGLEFLYSHARSPGGEEGSAATRMADIDRADSQRPGGPRAGVTLAPETMIDLVEPAGQREAQALDMLMLLAS